MIASTWRGFLRISSISTFRPRLERGAKRPERLLVTRRIVVTGRKNPYGRLLWGRGARPCGDGVRGGQQDPHPPPAPDPPAHPRIPAPPLPGRSVGAPHHARPARRLAQP